MAFTASKTLRDLQQEETAKREAFLDSFKKSPYMGVPTMDEALERSRFTSQAEVLARLLRRENVFISGLAGAGKTAVIETFIKLIDAEHQGAFHVAVTASTGIAASLINGSTIHSWAGLGISTEPFDRKKVEVSMRRKRSVARYTDVLIIDEISMLPAYLFTKLDAYLKWARQSNEPFGGVQLVLIGDFLQLPPVSKSEEDVDTRFAIETEEWKAANIHYCFLDRTYRASDNRLKRLLMEISLGKVSERSMRVVEQRQEATRDPNKVYTTLFTTNKNVDAYNLQHFKQNPNQLVTITMEVSPSPKTYIDKAKKKFSHVPEVLLLKKDAVVMLTQNTILNGHYMANGSMGKVKYFHHLTPVVEFNNGITVPVEKVNYEYQESKKYTDSEGKERSLPQLKAVLSQVPLKLAYAITVHKSQGQTFDGVVMDLSNCFQEGLGYVALSRVRSMDDMVIQGFNPRAYVVSEKAKAISIFVKKKSRMERKKFLAERDKYESMLINHFARMAYWNISDSGSARKAEEDANAI